MNRYIRDQLGLPDFDAFREKAEQVVYSRGFLITVGVVAVSFLTYLLVNTKICQETCEYIGKRHEPAHYETHYQSQCVAFDRDGFCDRYIEIPYQVYVPDKYFVGLRDRFLVPHEVQVDAISYANPAKTFSHGHARWKTCD